jgi:hypothetical protein
MKQEYEDAIQQGKKTERIRSQKLIKMLHEFAVLELQKEIPIEWIYNDKVIYGYPKTKQQDILVTPPLFCKKKGGHDTNVTVGPVMSVNVRSQMSSIEKNYDTLYERLFAEALNLHNRFPHLVLGYIYLLPKTGYDNRAAKQRKVVCNERYDMEKYILSFMSVADRKDPNDTLWKYEKISLLIADFEQDPPAPIDDLHTLAKQQIVSNEFAKSFSFDALSVRSFFDDLHRILTERYYLLEI